MTTQFNDWLAECEAAGKGGATFKWVAARGQAFSQTLRIAGDWTGATMAAKLKAHPDAATTLASFTVGSPVVSVEDGATWTRFTFTLASGSGANSTGSLPADTDQDGITQLALIVQMTPSGGTQDLFAGGRFVLLGV